MSDILDILDELDDDYEAPSEEVDDEIEEASRDLQLYEMNEAEAKEITEAIRSASTATYILLSQAHTQKAHKALGYHSWADYVKTEFEMSSQRSYQLMDLSKVVEEIQAVTPEGTRVRLTEAQARDIKRELPRITEQIASATSDSNAKDASEIIDRIVEDSREQRRLDEEALKAKQALIDEAEEEKRRAELEAQADYLLEADQPDYMTSGADGEFIEVEVEGDGDGSLSPQDSMHLYNLFNALNSITSLPEPDEMIKLIPQSREDEIDNQLIEVVGWFNRFQTLWEIRN